MPPEDNSLCQKGQESCRCGCNKPGEAHQSLPRQFDPCHPLNQPRTGAAGENCPYTRCPAECQACRIHGAPCLHCRESAAAEAKYASAHQQGGYGDFGEVPKGKEVQFKVPSGYPSQEYQNYDVAPPDIQRGTFQRGLEPCPGTQSVPCDYNICKYIVDPKTPSSPLAERAPRPCPGTVASPCKYMSGIEQRDYSALEATGPPPGFGQPTKIEVPMEPPCDRLLGPSGMLAMEKDVDYKPPVRSEDEKMGPIGPWATGRVDWSPLGELTGTRPVVDRYSITRYSVPEWQLRNQRALCLADEAKKKSALAEFNGRKCIQHSTAMTDKNQADNTRRLAERAHKIHYWMTELERAINAMREEMELLAQQRKRLLNALGVLKLPEAIAGECLDRRTCRLEKDLVRDRLEEELIKENALLREVHDLYDATLQRADEQLAINQAAKERLEMDWSDKKEAHEIETRNISLTDTSPTLMYKPGASRFPTGQSTIDSWENFSRENIRLSEKERMASVDLRNLIDKILTDASRDMRSQCDRVEAALSNQIAETDRVRRALENDLMQILQRVADTEKMISDLKEAIRSFDSKLKKAQTRLDNRLQRQRVENCRDEAQYGIISELKTIADDVSALKAQLSQTEDSLQDLCKTRGDLEREIFAKRKSLVIDKDRLRNLRSYYPSTVSLTGY